MPEASLEPPQFAVPAVATGGPGSAAVAAGSAEAVKAATEALRAGGNAVDGAIAGVLAACVSEVVFTSLGGGGFMIVRQPQGEIELLDFFTAVPGVGSKSIAQAAFTPVSVEFPGTNQIFHAGPGSVAVPGNLSGLLSAHAAWGRLPLARVASPAIQLAIEGAPLEPLQAVVLDLVREIMLLTPQSRALIESNGVMAEPGDIVANADLAGVLQLIADGEIRSFADPFLANRLLPLIQDAGGIMTMADLRTYEPVLREPILLERGGAQIALNPPPAFGGAIVADALTHTPTLDDSPASWESVVAALRAATDHHRAHGSETLSVNKGTTHISVTDADGQMVSLTTSNGSGSGVVIPETGIHLNNMLGEADLNPAGFHGQAAGTRMSSMMSPCIVQDAYGTVTGLGTGGSERIRSTLATTLLRLIDLGKPLDRAIAEPRMHPEPEMVQLEPGWPPQALDHLETNHRINTWPSANLFFGGVHAVSRSADGSVTAVGDNRRAGAVAVVEP